jgi:chaperone BCS1
MSSEGRLLFLTTNHKEVLDPALTRPGRVDLDIVIANATYRQAMQLFTRFYPDMPDLAESFGRKAVESEVSMAHLQGHLVKHRHDPLDAIASEIEKVNT